MPEVVFRELLRVALDCLPPEPPGALHAPLHLPRGPHAPREAYAEVVQQLQPLHPASVGGPHAHGLVQLHAGLLELLGRGGQRPEVLELRGQLAILLGQLFKDLPVMGLALLHGLPDLGLQLPVGRQRGPGVAEVLQREVCVQPVPVLEDVAVQLPDPLHMHGVVLPHGVYGAEAPRGAYMVAVQDAGVLARDDGLIACQPPQSRGDVLREVLRAFADPRHPGGLVPRAHAAHAAPSQQGGGRLGRAPAEPRVGSGPLAGEVWAGEFQPPALALNGWGRPLLAGGAAARRSRSPRSPGISRACTRGQPGAGWGRGRT
mmetsp:Transcript_136753/g.381161  ORF Transcript_136753/g.381161 Transcript_136753/m.381161 type:complete len:317 (+) Transcript_136753:902-1852(+)